MMTLDQYGHDKYNSDDRVFIFEPVEGTKVTAATGLVDPRLFTGENKLHAKKDDIYGLWYLQYEMGGLPPVLKQKWTSFNAMVKFARDYFMKRGLMIKEVEHEPKNSKYTRL